MTSADKMLRVKGIIGGHKTDMIINPYHIVHISFGMITLSTPFADGTYTVGIAHDENIDEKLKELGWLSDDNTR